MSHTGLAFYRRSQTLENLSTERPKSIEALHVLMLKSMEDVETKLRRVERNFYHGMKCEEYLQYLAPIFQHVMSKFQVTFVHAAWQIRDVSKRYNKFGDQFGVDRIFLSQFKEFGDRLNDLYPDQFNEVIQDVREITGHLNKYCRSFFRGKKDPLVDIATRYEREKQAMIKGVEEEFSKIKQMADEYKDKGVTQKVLSTATSQLGRKMGCSYITLLLIVPEACYCIRQACEKIIKWIQGDRHYPEIVKNDMSNLEVKRMEQLQEVRDARENNVLIEHRYKALQKESAEMEIKCTRLEPRSVSLQNEISKLNEKLNEIRIEINIKDDDVEDMRLRSAGCSIHGASPSSIDPDITDKLDELQSEVSHLKLTTIMINRQIDSKKAKLKLIQDKEIELEALKKETVRYGKMTMVSKTEVVLAVREMEKIERCLGQLKDIHIKRTCPNITKKIFHGMPITTRSSSAKQVNQGGNNILFNKPRAMSSKSAEGNNPKSFKPKIDPLERACLFVSKHIGSDWPRLYRSLDFFPRRGESTLDQDIDQLIKTHYRGEAEYMSREALARWRRMHCRAAILDIKTALTNIGRHDILKKLDDMVKAKESKNKKGMKRNLQIRHAIARFMMLKRMGMTLPSAQAEKARQHGLLEHSAMANHVSYQQHQPNRPAPTCTPPLVTY